MLNQGLQFDQDLLDSLICFSCSIIFKARDLKNHKGSDHPQFSVVEVLEAVRDPIKNLQKILNEFSEVELLNYLKKQLKQCPPQFHSEIDELIQNYPMLIEQQMIQLKIRQEECNILSFERVDCSYMKKHIKFYRDYFQRGDAKIKETKNLINEISILNNDIKFNLEVRFDNSDNQSKQLDQLMKKLIISSPYLKMSSLEVKSDSNDIDEFKMEQIDFSRFQIIKLEGGSTYQGEMKMDQRHGIGKLIDPNGNTFIGEFKEGKVNGKGIVKFHYGDKKGDRCKAEYIDDRIKNQQVKYFYSNGNIYEGTMFNFIRDGQGKMTYKDGDICIGEWKGGLFHGEGICIKSNGDTQEGQWKYDKMDGQGILKSNDGSRYEGQWKDGLLSGQGILYLSDGNTFEGQWKDGKMNGQGISYHNNGNRHEGLYKDHFQNGYGTCYYSDGGKYEGNWKDAKKDGQGILYYKEGHTYEGQFKDDLPHGQGKLVYKNGSYYSGSWVKAHKNGHGTYVRADGKKFEGEWVNDKLNGKTLNDLNMLWQILQ